METPRTTHETSRWAAAAVLATSAALLAWLWPIGIGGATPIGGDVSQFFMGLMGVLSESLAARRIPAWNDLWGYGFPGVGESQMGVFYPPHLVLYGMLSVERAYVASLVLHTLWGGLGAYWAGRVFGLGRAASAFSAFVFGASGFFVIHMPHPWGYTTGSWLPWAWGAAWRLLDDDPDRTSPSLAFRVFVLALVLVLQILPGHFQIAFMTQASIAALAVWSCVDRVRPRSLRAASRRLALTILAVAVVFPLAAVQVWPTARLARLASSQRDYEYLSGFAETPFHLVGLVAPNLFHESPLWRPIVWDPFHTSPEECLIYVGIAPLFLAVLSITREARRDRDVRCLGMLAAACLALSLGPYVPGFRLLIELPGFSFFRAPARWTLPASLALALLAGKGLDAWARWERAGRWLGVLAVGAVAWTVSVVGLIELALWSATPSGSNALGPAFDRAFALRPWADDQTFRNVAALARAPVAGEGPRPRSFEQARFDVYRNELAGTAAVLAAVAAVSILSGVAPARRSIPILLVVLTGADLWLLGRHRLVDVGPLRPLVEQSTVLARLAKEPRGTRTADPLRNLPMAVGLAPVQAYRTLDLPALAPPADSAAPGPPSLAALARSPLDDGPKREAAFRAMRALGVGLRLLDPVEASSLRRRGTADVSSSATVERLSDPALARWIFGAGWNPGGRPEADEFLVLKPTEPAARAWFLPSTVAPDSGVFDLPQWDPGAVLDLLDRARPLGTVARSPEEWDVKINVDEPGWAVVSQLDDPQWRARLVPEDGEGGEPVNILSAFRVKGVTGAWQRVFIDGPRAGAVLRLSYDARDVRLGGAVSAVSWGVWLIATAFFHLASRRRSKLGILDG